MKKTVLISLLLANSVFAAELSSYREAVNAVHSGKRLTFVMDWDLCTISVPGVQPNQASSFSPEVVNIYKDQFIQARGVSYSHTIKALPELGPVNQAYVYQFNSHNQLHVVNYFLDPVSYKEKMPAVEATCQLRAGFKVFAGSE